MDVVVFIASQNMVNALKQMLMDGAFIWYFNDSDILKQLMLMVMPVNCWNYTWPKNWSYQVVPGRPFKYKKHLEKRGWHGL
jgi:hypothetical protein